MKQVNFHETFTFIVDLYDYEEINKLEKELKENKTYYTKTIKNKHNNRTQFEIPTTVNQLIQKTIINLKT